MLSSNHKQHGATLLELVIGLIMVSILIALALPNFRLWMQNTSIRNAAESIKTGLQLARTEAVRRNALVHFSLVSSVDNSCALSTASASWVVSMLDPSGNCAATPMTVSTDPAPKIIQVQSQSVGSGQAIVMSDSSAVIFNGLGQLTTPAANICIGITGVALPPGCYTGSDDHHLEITVSSGGQIRMCDPRFSIATDPQGC